MPSKFRTGDNPFGGAELGSAKGITGAHGLDSSLARLTNKIAQGQPKASRDVQVTHTPNGVIINPIVRGRKQKAVDSHPWFVKLITDNGDLIAVIEPGEIYDGLLSVTEVNPTLTEESVGDGDLVCLEYTYEGGTIKNIIVDSGSYEPFTDDGADPPVLLTTIQPIAKIADVDGTLKVVQIARNNYALSSACINGKILKQLTAL